MRRIAAITPHTKEEISNFLFAEKNRDAKVFTEKPVFRIKAYLLAVRSKLKKSLKNSTQIAQPRLSILEYTKSQHPRSSL